MPLIDCPDCGRAVSPAAPTCPGCGRPLAPQTIESTGKRWKALQALSLLMLIYSVFWWVFRATTEQDVGGPVLLFMASLMLNVIGRVGAWWKHG